MSPPSAELAGSPTPAPREGRRTALRYSVLLVAYVVLGYFTKSAVLNWIVGPLFPLLVLYLVPRLVGVIRGRPVAR